MSEFTIHVVDDQGCPRCGAHGSPKVTDEDGTCWWKCKTPSCTVGFWVPEDGRIEERGTPDERAEMAARIKAEVDAMMEGKSFVRVDDGSRPGIEQWELR